MRLESLHFAFSHSSLFFHAELSLKFSRSARASLHSARKLKVHGSSNKRRIGARNAVGQAAPRTLFCARSLRRCFASRIAVRGCTSVSGSRASHRGKWDDVEKSRKTNSFSFRCAGNEKELENKKKYPYECGHLFRRFLFALDRVFPRITLKAKCIVSQ